MIKIELKDLLNIEMDINETDAESSGFNCAMNVNIYQFDGSVFMLNLKSLWFVYETWDEFLKSLLGELDRMNSILTDTYSEIQIKFRAVTDGIELTIIAKKDSSQGAFNFQFTKEISKDDFYIIRNAFNDFPKWW